MSDKPRYTMVATVTTHRIPAKLRRLAKMMTKERGIRVYMLDAINVAIDEAIERRKS